MPTHIQRSVCPYDCPDSCGLLVEVEDERVLSVKGDPEHPFSRGTLCAKMNHYEKTVHSPRRLTEPLLRCGKKGQGEFRPISWPEAIDQIANRWRKIIAEFGPQAILPYSYAGTMGIIQRNAGHPFFHRMGASLLERGICTPAKGVGWQAVMGETPAPSPNQVLHSDLIILWGSNAAATNLHFLHLVRQAKKKGAKVWTIDLYPNQTCAVAEKNFLVQPGSDGALSLGLMHILVRDNLCDEKFLATQVVGFKELKAQILPDYNPEKVSRITGLSPQVITKMARDFAAADAPFISIGGGLSRYTNGAMSVRSIVALPALVGAWAKKGGGCFVGTSSGAAFDMALIERPDFLKGKPRTINMSRLGEALTQTEDPPIKSLFIYHSNPAAVAPDQNLVLEGLAREDLFTVVHERFMTDSARYADLVLPATTSLETSDIYRAYGSYSVQRTRPLIPPQGQSKSNRELFALLATAMGYNEPYFQLSANELIAQLCETSNNWWQGIDKQSFNDGLPAELTPPTSQGYATPSGRIEILNLTLKFKLPCYLPIIKDRFPLQLVTAPALKTLNSTFSERDDLREKRMCLKVNPVEALSRGLEEHSRVTAFNDQGEVEFYLQIDNNVPVGIAVAEGVWWIEFAPGKRTVNALTSQRLTDLGGGSTFYDNRIDLR
ncbi:MAG: molybdopterin oxidoreductase family protein [Geopsychrobacter sp.]|nr:molybdopterin oxidoreductase family protein [Geopsychrobacter sp.]